MDIALNSVNNGILSKKTVDRNLVSVGLRFRNYLLDLMAIITITTFIGILMKLGKDEMTISFSFVFFFSRIVAFFYYWSFEYTFGATLGKLITNTRVVRANGQPLGFGLTFKRSLCRFIPFDGFSFFGPKAIGWHDSISGTRVVSN